MRLSNIELTPTDLPEPVVPPTRRCGIFARSATRGFPSTDLPNATGSAPVSFRNDSEASMSRIQTVCRVSLGISIPTTPLPGMGARMWTRRLQRHRDVILKTSNLGHLHTGAGTRRW